MSKKFNWNDEENEEFRDIPDEVNEGGSAPALQGAPIHTPKTNMTREQLIAQAQGQPQQAQSVDQVAEQYADQVTLDEDGEEDYSEVLSDARLRLEQGRLYEMVMNNDLFEGMEADDRAIKSVQRQIKRFAKEQMEIMLGMRQEKIAQQYAEFNAALAAGQFNDLEVMLLKQLASKMSGGKTEESQPEKYVEPAQAPQAPAKRVGIKPIATKQQATRPVSKPLAKAPAAPIKRQAAQPTPEELLGLPEEVEKPLDKPLEKMTIEEKAARMKRIHERQSALKAKQPQSTLPQPTFDQQEMLATIRSTEADSKGTVSAIMALMNAQKLS